MFVDRSMRIKWFTPRATDIFSMLPVDTGRSLLDITHRLHYEDLAVDAEQVFESLNMIEREVSSTDNRWYIARLLPYRSSEDHIDGTVLTFIDITKRRAAEAACAWAKNACAWSPKAPATTPSPPSTNTA